MVHIILIEIEPKQVKIINFYFNIVDVKHLITAGRYLDPCSTAARNTSCYPPLICSSSVCHCELPAMMHYDAGANTCNDGT